MGTCYPGLLELVDTVGLVTHCPSRVGQAAGRCHSVKHTTASLRLPLSSWGYGVVISAMVTLSLVLQPRTSCPVLPLMPARELSSGATASCLPSLAHTHLSAISPPTSLKTLPFDFSFCLELELFWFAYLSTQLSEGHISSLFLQICPLSCFIKCL